MADNEGKMTFDALSSVYRTEINSTSLTNIRKDFYTAVQELIEEQSKECDRLAQENPDSIVYDGANQRKKNMLMNLRKIVEKRMDKIAGMAMRGAMGANNVIDNLTPEEKEYYNSVLEASKVFWKLSEKKRKVMISPDITKVDGPVVEKVPEPVVQNEPIIEKRPVSDDIPLSEIPMDDSPEELLPKEEVVDDELEEEPVPVEVPLPEPIAEIVQEPVEEPPAAPENVPNPLEGISDEENVIIRILEDLPPFSGLEWDYVLKKEDIVRMPAVLAKALINRGMARLVPTA